MDNSVPIMGAEFTDLGDNYNDLYNETLQHDMKDIPGKIIGDATSKSQNSGKSIVQSTTRSEHEMYRQKTFKVRESSSMAGTRKT